MTIHPRVTSFVRSPSRDNKKRHSGEDEKDFEREKIKGLEESDNSHCQQLYVRTGESGA
jgi:hypothetical protein